MIHRDIKPANIFMVGRTQPRVLDFGIARVAHQQDSSDPHSAPARPTTWRPSRCGSEPADRRADVFSLGVVLYELLTDVKPFRGESLAEIRDAVLHHEPPLANKVDPPVPKALAAIAARAMAKDPEQRFRSARSFARELRQWLDDNPAGADGEKTAPSGAAAGPRSRVVLGAAARRRASPPSWRRSRPGSCWPRGRAGAGRRGRHARRVEARATTPGAVPPSPPVAAGTAQTRRTAARVRPRPSAPAATIDSDPRGDHRRRR